MPPKKTSEDELSGLKDVGDIDNFRSTVLYGRSGTGKTTIAASWPKPMLYLDVRDRGTDSISDIKGIQVKEIEDYDDLEDTLLWLIRNPKKYKTVVIDTVSQLQELMVEEQAERSKKKKSTKLAGDWGTLTKQDWGSVSAKMKSLIIDFRNLPMEVVFIAQDRSFGGEEDEDGDETVAPEIGPRLMPSVASVLNGAVSNIGNSFIRIHYITKTDAKGRKKRSKRMDYCLRIGPSSTYVTKVRKPKGHIAPDFIVDPTYDDILDIIEGVD